jgi:hypothetical protein
MVMLPVVVRVPVAGPDKMEVSSPVAGGAVLRAWFPLPRTAQVATANWRSSSSIG